MIRVLDLVNDEGTCPSNVSPNQRDDPNGDNYIVLILARRGYGLDAWRDTAPRRHA